MGSTQSSVCEARSSSVSARGSLSVGLARIADGATGAPPFDVAPQLLAARGRIDGDTVLNMAVSSDTIGGSSGSPVVNAAGEIVGANFDSTVLTQRNAYGYDRNTNRSVIVTTQAVTVALRDVYGVDHLLEELGVEYEVKRYERNPASMLAAMDGDQYLAFYDTGTTQDFDYPELAEGSYGYLPNDRRHVPRSVGHR